MTIRLICAGKLKEKWLKEAVAEYTKRISAYAKVELVEVQDASDSMPEAKAKAEESQRLLAKCKDSAYRVAFDLHGDMMDSEQFSEGLQDYFLKGGSNVDFLIAGSYGYDPALLETVDKRICLSPMTFPHQMTRVIVLEQIYRAFKIYKNEKYHK